MEQQTNTQPAGGPHHALENIVIPPCPSVLASVVRETRADEPDFNKISKLVMADIGLSSAILASVNSPYYGVSRKVQSIHQALVLAGMQAVLQMITRLLLRQAFPVANGKLMERFWTHSARAALAVSRLARELKAVNPETAQTYGLFRDCGIPVLLMNTQGGLTAEEIRSVNTVQDFHELDKTQLGVDHTFIGRHLASKWFLPGDVCMAIQRHHDEAIVTRAPSDISSAALSLIALGDLADHLAAPVDQATLLEDLGNEAASAMAQLGLSPAEVAELGSDLRGQLADAR